MLIGVAISGDRFVIKKEAEKILKHKNLTTEMQRIWNVEIESDTSNNTKKWNQLRIIQTVPEQRTGKARNQGMAHLLRNVLK
jgi:hypothetical protein